MNISIPLSATETVLLKYCSSTVHAVSFTLLVTPQKPLQFTLMAAEYQQRERALEVLATETLSYAAAALDTSDRPILSLRCQICYFLSRQNQKPLTPTERCEKVLPKPELLNCICPKARIIIIKMTISYYYWAIRAEYWQELHDKIQSYHDTLQYDSYCDIQNSSQKT